MALIEFKNLPDTSTPVNAENLNNNFNEIVKFTNYYNSNLLNSQYCGEGTNNKQMIKFSNGLCIINLSIILNAKIPANTSTQIMDIPVEMIPALNTGLFSLNINSSGKEVAYINAGEKKIRWRSTAESIIGNEIYIQGFYKV